MDGNDLGDCGGGGWTLVMKIDSAQVHCKRLLCKPDLNIVQTLRLRIEVTAPFNNIADSKIQSSTGKCVFRYRQSNVRRLLTASDYCRTRGYQIIEHSSDNETVLGSSRKLGAAKYE